MSPKNKNINTTIKKIFLFFTLIFLVFTINACSSLKYFREKSLNSDDLKAEEVIEETANETSKADPKKEVNDTNTADNYDSEEITEPVNERQIKNDVMVVLRDFLDSVKKDQEYNFFSSYTTDLVGSESEYKEKINSNLYIDIHKNNSFWKIINYKSILIYEDRLLITIYGDRTIDGKVYNNDEESFRFIKEGDIWKLDFVLPLIPEIIPISPEPDSISDYNTAVQIKFDVVSFFPIRSVTFFINEKEYYPEDIIVNDKVKYARTILRKIPAVNLYRSINRIKVEAFNSYRYKGSTEWSFVLG